MYIDLDPLYFDLVDGRHKSIQHVESTRLVTYYLIKLKSPSRRHLFLIHQLTGEGEGRQTLHVGWLVVSGCRFNCDVADHVRVFRVLCVCIVGSRVERTHHVEKTTTPVWNKVYEVNSSSVVPAISLVYLIPFPVLSRYACVFNFVLAVCHYWQIWM